MRLAWALAFLLAGPNAGPYDIVLLPGPRAPAAHGDARLVFAESPFGVAVTADGHHRYDIDITARDLPAPASLGAYGAFVAWEVSPDLAEWYRLGAVHNGTVRVGTAEMNKFLVVITAERDSAVTQHAGPTMLHGTSPSGWLQTFLTHPLFRGISQ